MSFNSIQDQLFEGIFVHVLVPAFQFYPRSTLILLSFDINLLASSFNSIQDQRNAGVTTPLGGSSTFNSIQDQRCILLAKSIKKR